MSWSISNWWQVVEIILWFRCALLVSIALCLFFFYVELNKECLGLCLMRKSLTLSHNFQSYSLINKNSQSLCVYGMKKEEQQTRRWDVCFYKFHVIYIYLCGTGITSQPKRPELKRKEHFCTSPFSFLWSNSVLSEWHSHWHKDKWYFYIKTTHKQCRHPRFL